MNKSTVFTLAGSLLGSSLLITQHAGASQDYSGYVAAGLFVSPEYEGSEDYDAKPLIAARVDYDGYYFETRGLGLRGAIEHNDSFDYGISFTYRMKRDDDLENDFVKRLREVDDAFEIGAFGKFKTNGVFNRSDELSFEVEILTDVSGTHDGTFVNFGPSYSYSPSERLRLGFSIGMTYATDDYAETYFSIDADNSARSGLAQYEAEGGLKDIGFTVTANYALDKSWGLIAIAGYQELLGDFADSPIVDDQGDSSQLIFGLGATYRF